MSDYIMTVMVPPAGVARLERHSVGAASVDVSVWERDVRWRAYGRLYRSRAEAAAAAAAQLRSTAADMLALAENLDGVR